MRSDRLRGCLIITALFAGTSSASAQVKSDEKTDKKADDKAKPAVVAQAEPQAEPPPPAEPSPQTGPTPTSDMSPTAPGARTMTVTEEQLRKMVEEQMAKSRPKGPALEFAGYARGTVGLAAQGGKQVCFGLAGADTKWRLGNECDYVIEPQFTARIVNREDKSSWGVVAMPGLYRTFQDPPPNSFSNVPAEFRQIYFFGEGVPQLLNGRVWGGRRYYDRLHLNINDQFLEIEDGDGAGIEDMNVGVGKVSVAFLMNPNSEAATVNGPTGDPIATANLAPFKLTARITDIATAKEGSLQIWAALYGSSTSKDQQDTTVVIPKPDNLFRFAAYHTLGKILGGTNFVGAKVDAGSNHLQWRAVVQEQMAFNNEHTAVDLLAEYRSNKNRANSDAPWIKNDWFSLGGRVDTQLSGPFRFLVEAGVDRVMPETGDAPLLVKTTAAFAINAGETPGNVPSFRLFYTHGFWNDAAKTSPLGVFQQGQSGTRLQQVYGDASNGGAFGIQAEAWW
jgi:maltoporin